MKLDDDLGSLQELLQRIFDTVPFMITIYDPNTNVLRVNRAFERLIGWSSDELATVSLMEECYPDPEYREQARQYMQACRPEWRDWSVTTRDGSEIQSSWTNLRLSDNTQLGIGVDITERKRTESALRESEERLKHAHRLKDEFLAMLAHELRNPLAPMRSAVEILRDVRAPAAVADEALAILDRQLGVVVRLIDDLLDVSRINTGKIALQRSELDLRAVVQKAVQSSQSIFEARRQRLNFEPGSGEALPLDGDATRLEQVFTNLLHNAAKFTPPLGAIDINIQRQGDQAVVHVRDSGIGIAPDLLPRVFDLFVQADRGFDRLHDGLGIGLNLVKRLVELHGGQVEAISAGLGQGSDFVVRLPLRPAAELAEAIPAVKPAALAGGPETRKPNRRTILVVDDNVDAATALALALSQAGDEVLLAHDARSGLERAKTREFDVIVMDLGMPGMSGYQMAETIRSDPQLNHVLLVALTGWSDAEARSKSARVGFDHHLVKPVALSALRELLDRPNRRRTR
jgi:two-component system CheB/CheR fusion protein